jgi:hypothetical protein
MRPCEFVSLGKTTVRALNCRTGYSRGRLRRGMSTVRLSKYVHGSDDEVTAQGVSRLRYPISESANSPYWD